MRFIKTSTREHPKVSLVLLDWSVRESFHLLHYLSRQTALRDAFEVILVEYFSTISPAAQRFQDEIDVWIVLDMPEETYYHKHLMYNVGIEFARGDIIMIGDSDAMVRESFIETIIRAFEADPNIVFHIDQFRNLKRAFYPFNFPTFEQVLDEDCINNADGKTAGVVERLDPLHARNYGACMCARREDLIAIGGADEHIDYLGHICGPYDMTFRLVNMGRREVWSESEFSYHTWHPGQAGSDNYLGPHDGRHMSTTALEALLTGRKTPLVENDAIRARRLGRPLPPEEAALRIIRPEAAADWAHALLDGRVIPACPVDARTPVGKHLGVTIFQDGMQFFPDSPLFADSPSSEPTAEPSLAAARRKIDARTPPSVRRRAHWATRISRAIQTAGRVAHRIRRPPTLALIKAWGSRSREQGPPKAAMDQWTSSIDLANLVAQSLALPEKKHELAVLNRSSALALRLMMACGQLPARRVHVVDDVDAARRLRDRVRSGAADGVVLAQGLAFMRHYPILSELSGDGLIIA